jgi:hypothetical protein
MTLIAQKVEGGPVLEKRLPKGKKSPVPLQDPNAPKFGEEDRLHAGPWVRSDYATLDAVRAHYQQLGPSTKHRITFECPVLVIEYPNKDVVEYRWTGRTGVQQRSLSSASGRYLEAYKRPKPTDLKAEFKAGAWEVSHQQTLKEVEAYWRRMYVNFDNVEVLQVILYRLGQDEYEYVKDANTGEVWARVLKEVK